MSDQVKFEEEEILVDRASQISRRSVMADFIIRIGLAKSESQATNIMIGVIVVTLLITLFVVSRYLI